MIFTAVPLLRSQTTSRQFSDYGANGLAPGEVGQVRISAMRTSPLSALMSHYLVAWAYVASALTSKAVQLDTAVNIISTSVVIDLFVRPPMVVTLKGRLTEAIENQITALGFSRQSSGKYNFFKGPATDAAIRGLAGIGVETDSYCPQGNASIDGIMALSILNRIIRGAFGFLASAATALKSPLSDAEQVEFNMGDFAITAGSDITTVGVFIPYFDGLVLPDRSCTVRLFLHRFSLILGKNAAEIGLASRTVSSGWNSLHNTPSGRAISHAMFCIDLALSAGYQMKPVFLNNEYQGCVFIGTRVAFLNGSRAVTPSSVADLVKEVTGMQSHDSALSSIAETLAACSLEEGKDSPPLSAEVIKSPRILHNLIRERCLDASDQAKIRTQILRLKFRETLWDTSNPSHIALAFKAITSREFLPSTAPFAHKTDALFTKEHIFSTLAAFGIKAPSLIGTGNTMTLRVKGNMYTSVTSPGNLPGVPIFIKPLQEAYEDWDKLLRDEVVSFSHKGKDKLGRIKVSNLGMFIPSDSQDGKAIIAGLTAMSSRKRKRVETEDLKDGPSIDKEDVDREKKRRLKGLGVLGLAPLLPAGVSISASTLPAGEPMEEDDFWAS